MDIPTPWRVVVPNREQMLLIERVRSLFPLGVAAHVAGPDTDVARSDPVEFPSIARAVLQRKTEFALGRACARRALIELGEPPVSIPVGEDRGPIWPEGVVGSISHCAAFCAAVVAHRRNIIGLGLDVEGVEPLDEDLQDLICLPDELAHFRMLREDVCTLQWTKLAFSAKEAFYKVYRPITATFLDFRDVRISLFLETRRAGTFGIDLRGTTKPPLPEGSRFEGRWVMDDCRVYTGASLLGAKG